MQRITIERHRFGTNELQKAAGSTPDSFCAVIRNEGDGLIKMRTVLQAVNMSFIGFGYFVIPDREVEGSLWWQL